MNTLTQAFRYQSIAGLPFATMPSSFNCARLTTGCKAQWGLSGDSFLLANDAPSDTDHKDGFRYPKAPRLCVVIWLRSIWSKNADWLFPPRACENTCHLGEVFRLGRETTHGDVPLTSPVCLPRCSGIGPSSPLPSDLPGDSLMAASLMTIQESHREISVRNGSLVSVLLCIRVLVTSITDKTASGRFRSDTIAHERHVPSRTQLGRQHTSGPRPIPKQHPFLLGFWEIEWVSDGQRRGKWRALGDLAEWRVSRVYTSNMATHWSQIAGQGHQVYLGCSLRCDFEMMSVICVWYEWGQNGPLHVADNHSLYSNNFSWDKLADYVWIDQPVYVTI